MDPKKMYLSCTQIHSSLTKLNSLNILDFYYHYYHHNSERMKFITQGETPVINANDNLEIVETDAHGNELVTLPTVTAAPLPIIWLTDDISNETITAMIATEQYAIRIYADIEKDAADIPGYKKPLFLVDQIFLSLPGVDEERLLTNDDKNGPTPTTSKSLLNSS